MNEEVLAPSSEFFLRQSKTCPEHNRRTQDKLLLKTFFYWGVWMGGSDIENLFLVSDGRTIQNPKWLGLVPSWLSCS